MAKVPQRCIVCGQLKILTGRKLCESDYRHARRSGLLPEFPRSTVPRSWFVEEFEHLKQCGVSEAAIPRALGMQWKAFERAMYRAGYQRPAGRWVHASNTDAA